MQGNYKYFRYKRLSDARFLCKLFMKLAGKIIVLPQLVIQHRESRSSHAAAVMTSPFSDDISGGAISPLASYVIDFFLSSALLVFSAFSAIVDTCYSLVNSECLVQSVFCRRILVTLAPDCVINRFTSSEPESATGCSRRPRFAQYVTLTSTQAYLTAINHHRFSCSRFLQYKPYLLPGEPFELYIRVLPCTYPTLWILLVTAWN